MNKSAVMAKLKIVCTFLFIISCFPLMSQVKVRIFASQAPEYALFRVNKGHYELDFYNGRKITLRTSEPVLIAKFKKKIAVEVRNCGGYICDSVKLEGKTGDDEFSLQLGGRSHIRQVYSGSMECLPDFETLVFINTCDIENYVAGVVMAEGGTGRNPEYCKTQAIIARTYMYKYYNKHITDKYNVCDNTHCQVYNGISSDHIINKATLDTKGLVILDKDSTLIISAFHSNCGGETASSEDVWLSEQPYLKSVADPYCRTSRNALWRKCMSVNEWEDYLHRSGLKEKSEYPSVYNFLQDSRTTDYKTGSFSIPFTTIRNDLNLRSAYFSVYAAGDSIIFMGKGYGHGVGLCQEGAMVMAAKGFSFRDIIKFYYSGVIIADIKNALILDPKTIAGR